MKDLVIRADAMRQAGTGHVMRCLALAQAWRNQGGKVTFISHCESDALKERIQGEGFGFIALDNICPDSYDLTKTLSILKNESSNQKNWLVLDGYYFTPEYQKAIRKEGICLLVIDDMNHLPHYHADILLNQNIHAPDIKYCCDKDTTLLLGTRYVLLRREFLKYRDYKRLVSNRAKNILVTLGGSDPDNVTLKIIEALKLLDEPDIMVRIIIGPANLHQETLRKSIVSAPFSVELLINPPDMPALMAWADLALSAGGSTCWELAFFRLPNIILYCADNQKPISEKLHEYGVGLNLGWHTELSSNSIAVAINQIITNQAIRTKMIENADGLVDGRGAVRICQALEKKLARSIECQTSVFSRSFYPEDGMRR